MKDFVTVLLRVFEQNAIPYAIGGSIASSYYGEPRTTQDIDLSIQLAGPGVDQLAEAFEARGWYISRDEVSRAIRIGGSFSTNDGFWKADIFVVKDDAFALEAFRRRREGTLFLTGDTVWFLSPEDVIVHKLRWCEGKPLEKHVRDIAAMLRVQGDSLDLPYVTRWANEFGAGAIWAGLLDAFRRSREG